MGNEVSTTNLAEIVKFPHVQTNSSTRVISSAQTALFTNKSNTTNSTGLVVEKSSSEQTNPFLSKTTKPSAQQEPTQDEINAHFEEIHDTFKRKRNLGFDEIKYSEIEELALLPKEQYQRIKSRNLLFDKNRNVQFNPQEIKLLSRLSDEEFKKIKNNNLYNIPQRDKNQFSGEMLCKWAKKSDKFLKRAEKLAYVKERNDNQFSEKAIDYIANLSDEHYENFEKRSLIYIKERGNNQIGGMAGKLAELSDKDFETIKQKGYLYDTQLAGGVINFLAKFFANTPQDKLKKLEDSGFLNLIQEGKINSGALCFLSENADLSDEILQDLQVAKDNKSTITEFREGTNQEEILKNTATGDVIQVGQKMYINDGEQIIPWQMTKEKYLELFPQIERFSTQQGHLHDCGLVSAIDSCIKNPNTRSKLYQLFSQDGNDVKLKLKGGNKTSVTFKNGNINLGNENMHLIGCKGLQMLEQAYAIDKNTNNDNTSVTAKDMISKLSHSKLMKSIEFTHNSEAISNLLDCQNYSVQSNDEFSHSERENLFNKYANNPNHLLQFGTIAKNKQLEAILDEKYGIASEHAYSVVGYDAKSKIAKIVNPINCNATINIPLNILEKYIYDIDVINIK